MVAQTVDCDQFVSKDNSECQTQVILYSPYSAPFVPNHPANVYWVPRECQYAPHDAHFRLYAEVVLRPLQEIVNRNELRRIAEEAYLIDLAIRFQSQDALEKLSFIAFGRPSLTHQAR